MNKDDNSARNQGPDPEPDETKERPDQEGSEKTDSSEVSQESATDTLRRELSQVFADDAEEDADEVVLIDMDAAETTGDELQKLVQEAIDDDRDRDGKKKKKHKKLPVNVEALIREKAQLAKQIETFSAELYNLRTEMKRLEEEKLELLDQAKRARAELVNFRKRVEREKEETAKMAGADIIEQIIPVLDNFQRALASAGPDVPENYSRGIELIYQELMATLRKMGLATIEAKGRQFDPNLHEAMVQERTTAFPDNAIIDEFQKGYMLHDKLLRPSMVKVALNEQEQEAADVEAVLAAGMADGGEAPNTVESVDVKKKQEQDEKEASDLTVTEGEQTVLESAEPLEAGPEDQPEAAAEDRKPSRAEAPVLEPDDSGIDGQTNGHGPESEGPLDDV